MTVKRLDQNKQTSFVQQAAGKVEGHGMTVFLFRGPQDQVFFLPECLVSSQFLTMIKPIVWGFYSHLPKSIGIRSLGILNLWRFHRRGMNSVLLTALSVQCIFSPQLQKTITL